MNNILCTLLYICVFLYGMMQKNFLIYLIFSIYAIYNGIKKSTWDSFKSEAKYFASLLLCSAILPDNYLVIAISIFECAYIFFKYKYKPQLNKLIKISLLYLVINIVFNKFLIINFLFSILYYIPILTLYYIFSFYRYKNVAVTNYVSQLLKILISVQYSAVIGYAITHVSKIKSMIDFDWVVGTFGEYQCNILLLFCITSAILFLSQFSKTKKVSDIVFFALSMILAVMTGSIAMLVMFIVAFVLCWIVFAKSSLKKRVIYIIASGVMVIFFVLVTPDWIINDLGHLTNWKYINYRISKIKTYETTFIMLPQEDPVFFIKGAGMGQYSSRAALTCTGDYISAYNKIFPKSISNYTDKYIYTKYKYVIENRLGSLDTPYSSIITIQGELGIIGTILLVCFLFSLIHGKNIYIKNLMLFFFMTLFIENYLEFAKVIVFVYIVYYVLDDVIETKKLVKNEKKVSRGGMNENRNYYLV